MARRRSVVRIRDFGLGKVAAQDAEFVDVIRRLEGS